MVKKSSEKTKQLLNKIIFGMQEKKAHDIVQINIGKGENSIADYFVICHGTSKIQVSAITDSVEEIVRKEIGDKPVHIEGKENSEWILMDYFNIVVHIFEQDKRAFFKLEDLWGDFELQAIT